MGQFHNITSADKVSTWRSKYAQGEGDDMQDWFIKVEGIDKPIKQTTKMESSAPSGQTYGSMEEFQSKRTGNPYLKFKREQAPDGTVTPPETTAPVMGNTIEMLVRENNELLKLLTGTQSVKPMVVTPPVAKVETTAGTEDVVIDEDTDVDEPVDLSDIPF